MKFDTLLDVAGIENIATQFNDPATNEVIKRFAEIKELIKTNNPKNSKIAFSKSSIRNLFNQIDIIICKRFGMNFKHISASEGTYGVFTTSSTVNNVLDPYKEYVYSETEKCLRQCSKTGECYTGKKQEEINDHDEDWGSILARLLENVKKVNEMINTKGIEIDFQNARVKNFPKDVTVFVVCDIVTLFREFNVEPEEITAFLFHEIGHQFTHLSESYRTVTNVTILLDTMHNEYSKNKDIRETIIITTKKHSNKNIDEDNFTQVLTELTNVCIKYMNNDDVYSYTDSESLADQFSTRFGLGKYLVTGLDKLNMKIEEIYGGPIMQIFNVIVTLFVTAFFVLLFAIPASLLTIIYMSLLIAVGSVVYTMLLCGSDASMRTYDDDTHRIKRVKFDMIRQLRETDLDKKVKKQIINDIERVEKILSKYPNSKYILERLGDVMPWNIDSFTLTRLSKELEELSENNLVLAKNKLEQFL